MFVELIESLRCPAAHEDAPLIATAVRTESRHIVDGLLGCPVCRAEFPITDGEALFDASAVAAPAVTPDAAVAMRLAAFLELTDAHGFALLCGGRGAHADQVLRLTETPLLLVNPPVGIAAAVAGVVRVAGTLPVAAGAARAAALDGGMSAGLVDATVRAVRTGGRVVGPASMPVPDGVTELVRDDQDWVGERSAAPDSSSAPRLVALKRAH